MGAPRRPGNANENSAPPLPYTLEENWTDGGWCTLGSGEFELEVRLFLDLGAQRSFGSLSLYQTIVDNIRKGNMGAARVATEIRNQFGEGWNGVRKPMTNWIEATIEADNAAGIPTIVPATMIAFCREANDEIIVAGKDASQMKWVEATPGNEKYMGDEQTVA